jgi:O-antigen/teichoic acid export membrane protein
MPPAPAEAKPTRRRAERFIINVLWSWTGVAATLFVQMIITPYLIHKLGAAHFGIWLLIFSILDYFWLFDLGLNTAVCNFCARFLAVRDHEKINQLMNTSLFYFSLIALAVWCIAPFLAANAHRFFTISPAYQPEFATLILITAISWGLCIMLHMFVSALDGFQRFDLTSRISVLMVTLRSAGYFFALKSGHGLVMMAWIFVATQIIGYVLNFLNFRRVFPQLRFSPSLVQLPMFRAILRYGLKSFAANSSTLVLNQGGTIMIAHYLSEAAVGFYGLPSRLMQSAMSFVSQIALVTRSSAAELNAAARREDTIALGIYSNRYSLTLFMPLVCFLIVYGRPLLFHWVGPAIGSQGAPLLPIFLLSNALVLAAQYNSSSLLFGVGRHGGYARGLMVEAAVYLAALVWVIPRYGIWGAAWTSAILMIAVRGIYTPWLVSRALQCSFLSYMRGIYVRPLLVGVPAVLVAWLLRASILPGVTWPQLILAGVLSGTVYSVLAIVFCVNPAHRAIILARIPVFGRA